MKLFMEMMAKLQSRKTGEEINHITRTRLSNLTNTHDLQEALDQNGKAS